MNKNTFGVFMFTIGAAIGSVVTWKLIDKKYKNIADEEIASVKEVFSRRTENTKIEDDVETDDEEDEIDVGEFIKYNEIASNYSNNNTKIDKKEEGEKMSTPYVISPDEFDEKGYTTQSLTYYADKVLTDEMDNVVEDIDGLVGAESLNHFGEYEDDSVFVRNDDLATDFEILLDVRNYSDVIIGDNSHQVDDE